MHHKQTKLICQITKFTLGDRIYPIECTYIKIEDILWPRQILRAVKVRAIWWGKGPCSFEWERWIQNSNLTHWCLIWHAKRCNILSFSPFILTLNLCCKMSNLYNIVFNCIAKLPFICPGHLKNMKSIRSNSINLRNVWI